MGTFSLSPNAVGLIPILILQSTFLLFLGRIRSKTAATRLLIGWLAAMFLVILFNFLAYACYTPAAGYFMGAGSSFGSLLAAAFWVELAYHFPRLRRPREARRVRTLSALLLGGMGVWLAYEIARQPVVYVYGFKDFYYGYFTPRPAAWPSATNVFNLLHPLGYLWSLVVWARQAAAFSAEGAAPFSARPVVQALRRPRGREARAARAFFLLTLSAFVPVLGSLLEGANLLPPGTFPLLYLAVMALAAVTYTNHAPHPTSFLVKLVGIPLVTLLLALGLVNHVALAAHDAAYRAGVRADVEVVRQQVRGGELVYVPPTISYLLARPVAAPLLGAEYRLHFGRDGVPDLAAFRREDRWLAQGLRRQSAVAYWATWHAFPWLAPGEVASAGRTTVAPPADAVSYRGALGTEGDHFLRHFFVASGRFYEAGASYPAYRHSLHRAALPLVALTFALSGGLLLLLPLFFRANLVQPLDNLLAGMRRVDGGNLQEQVPVTLEDEIGELTQAFNRMVTSLRQEMADRRQAEATAARLNVTLEQQVQERTRDLQVLYEVSAATSHIVDLEQALAVSLARSVSALEGVGGAVYRFQAGELHRVHAHGCPPALDAQTAHFPAGHPLTRWLAAHEQPRLLADLEQWLPGVGNVPPSLLSLLCPLQAAGEKLGLLVVARTVAQGFNVEEIALVISLGEQISGAIEADRLRRQAQRAAVLEERERIARDLHDSVTQALYGLVTFAEAGQAQIEAGAGPQVAPTFARIGAITRQALKEMRLFIHQLRPPLLAEEGLVGALHLRLAAVEGRANVQARLLADETITLAPAVEEAFYQIAQEALNNTLRHAGATAVTVYFSREGERVTLEILDNGCGFDTAGNGQGGDPAGGGMGLHNMRKRATVICAEFRIVSTVGRGTRVKVTVPAAGPEQKQRES